MRGAAEEPISRRTRGSTELGLPPAHPTLPSLLRAIGYCTALIGKWRLGFPPAFGPLRSGYQEFFGPMAGGVDYFTHRASNGMDDLWEGEQERAETGYLTDLISKRAVDYVQRMARQDAPFFLSLHHTAPHWPWETREDEALAPKIAANIMHVEGGNVHIYQRMIQHMDEGIGWLVDALRRHGQLENTLIVFTSDNGGERFSDNWPLVGGKMDLTEGGIRVPWIAHWPAAIAPGGLSAQQCMTMDWSATMLDIAGVAPHADYPLDGLSLAQLLRAPGHERGAQREFRRPLFWRMKHRGQRAMRGGPWKYLHVDGIDYLFNIEVDERERANQAKKEPQRLAAMRAQWEAWNATMPAIPEEAGVYPGYTTQDMPAR